MRAPGAGPPPADDGAGPAGRRGRRRRGPCSSSLLPSSFGVGGSPPNFARALLMVALAATLVAQLPPMAGAQPRADAAGPVPSAQSFAPASAPPAPPAVPGGASVEVAFAAELLAALENPSVGTVVLSRSVRLPVGWGPAVLSRPVTVSSSIRAIIDFCADGCGGADEGGGGKNATTTATTATTIAPDDVVRFVVAPSGTLSFHRVFMRNWVPPEGSPAASAAARAAAAAADDEEETTPATAAAAAEAPDVAASPFPGVRLMPGAALSMSLAAIHWTRDSIWLLSSPGGWWRRAADAGAIKALEGDGRGAVPGPLVADGRPRLHGIKGYSPEGRGGRSVQMSDCYMPFDLEGCMTRNAPFDEALVYCPYTTYDALRNPHVSHVRVFHPVGLDRLAYSPRHPLVVARRVQVGPCAKPQAADWPIVFDMDNVTASVLVDTGGSLALHGMTFQGSRGQPKGGRAWPGDLPLLLGAFQPVGSGRISVRDSVLRVPSPRAVRELLDDMPTGGSGGLESPDLAPVYASDARQEEAGEGEAGHGGGSRRRRRRRGRLLVEGGGGGAPGGGRPPGDESPFTIASWSISTGQWQRYVHGGLELGPTGAGLPAGYAGGGGGGGGLASWTFDDLTVERWEAMAADGPDGGNDRHCFHGSLTQSAVSIDGVRRVSTGAELRDALRDPSVRYLQVVSDLSWPEDDDGERGDLDDKPQAAVTRVLEVRACRNGDGGGDGVPFTVDWSKAPPGAVQVGGSLYFEGDMRMVGLGWRQQRAALAASAATGGGLASAQVARSAATLGPPLPIPAVRPVGDGLVVYEDVELAGEVTREDWERDVGRGFVSTMLGGVRLGRKGDDGGGDGVDGGGGFNSSSSSSPQQQPQRAYRLQQSQQQPFAAIMGVNYTLEAPARVAFAHLAVSAAEASAAAGLPPGSGAGIGRELFLSSSMVWGPPGWPGAAMPANAMSGGGRGDLSPGAAAGVGIAVAAGVLLMAAAAALLVKRRRRRRQQAAAAAGLGLGGGKDFEDGVLPLTGDRGCNGGGGSGSPHAGSDGSAALGRWWPASKAALLFGGAGAAAAGGSTTTAGSGAQGVADSATSHLAQLRAPSGIDGGNARRPSTSLSSSGGPPVPIVPPAPSAGALPNGGGKELSLTLGPGARVGVAASLLGGAGAGMQQQQRLLVPPSSGAAAAAAARSGASPLPPAAAVAAWSASQALRDAAAAGGLADEHVVLESVLGEGAHGRVYRGRWRGAAVAVKVVRLPAAPPSASGRRGGAAAASSRRERRRRMALMEIAISASLSHPNIVQTYTYAVVESPLAGARGQDDDDEDGDDEDGGGGHGNNAAAARLGSAARLKQLPEGGGNGAITAAASTNGGHNNVRKPVSHHRPLHNNNTNGANANGAAAAAAEDDDGGSTTDSAAGDPDPDADADADNRPGGAAAADYELRIIQEYCDRGSLRDFLRSRGHALSRPSAETLDEEDEPGGGLNGGNGNSGHSGSGPSGGGSGHSLPFPAAATLQSLRQSRQDLRRRLRFLAVLDTATDVARAGAHLHAQQLLHADIKTSNVLLKTTVAPPPAPPPQDAAASAGGFWAGSVSTALAEGGNGGGGQEEAELLAAAAAAAVAGAGVAPAGTAAAVEEASSLAAAAARLLPPRGFVAKIADFGLTRRLEDRDATHVSGAFVGTLSHMAPEVLLKGRVSRQSDVYAYGILMYELLSASRPFRGVPRALLGHGVARDGLRPSFPPDAPFDYALLAARCWESDPTLRPSFDDALRELARLRRRAAQEAAAAAVAVAAAERAAAALAAAHANGNSGSTGAWGGANGNGNGSGDALGWRGPASATSLAALAASAASFSAAAGGALPAQPLPHVAAPAATAAAANAAAPASAPEAAAAAIAAAAACAHPVRVSAGGSSCGDDDDDDNGGTPRRSDAEDDDDDDEAAGDLSGDGRAGADGDAPPPGPPTVAPSGPLVAMPDGDGTFGDYDATFGGTSRGTALRRSQGRSGGRSGSAAAAAEALSRSRYLSSDDDDETAAPGRGGGDGDSDDGTAGVSRSVLSAVPRPE